MVGGLLKSVSRVALVATAGLMMGGIAANAADLGGNCCADLEERVAELEATAVRKGNRKVSLTLSGQVNEAVMFFNDGGFSHTYVGGSNFGTTRITLNGDAKINADWTAGYLLQLGLRNNNSNTFTQKTDATQGSSLDIRRSVWYLDSKTYGRLWVGKYSQSNDGITDGFIANTDAITDVSQDGGFDSFFLRSSSKSNLSGSAQLSAVAYKDLFPTADWFAGQGHRANVVRYDTPNLSGFVGSASWGENDTWALALRYAGDIGQFKAAAGIGYSQIRGGNGNAGTTGCANPSNFNSKNVSGVTTGNPAPGSASAESAVSCTQLGLSASVMHTPTGLFVQGGYGINDDKNRDQLYQNLGLASGTAGTKEESYYIAAGIEQNFFGVGKSTFYGEYSDWKGGAALTDFGGALGGLKSTDAINSLTTEAYITSTEMKSWGLGYIQSVDAAALDLYVGYKHFDAPSVNLISATDKKTTGSGNSNSFDAVMAGARIKF